ncbi:SAM-dependent methyltransferase [Gallintestinimicrobium sp.]|uniref:SAM-dependent methyltransferase n=1 Tax=Gallintestinimicrobium sp. TaxID=2981655 RepID=UPI003AF13F5E
MSGNIKGIFYGVSTGPGDPELMTVKAVRILKKADSIVAARVMGKQETSLEIAKQAVCREKSLRTVFWKTRLMDISQL